MRRTQEENEKKEKKILLKILLAISRVCKNMAIGLYYFQIFRRYPAVAACNSE
jgi:hypothetical protein